jgi:sodium/hydrogen exchanger 8
MVSIVFGHVLKKSGHKYLQEAGLTTLIGMAAGFILKLMDVEKYMTDLSKHFEMLFMILLLPPIIFESGYNLEKKPFFKNLGTVILYAFIGTFIAIFSSAIMFYIVGQTSLSPAFSWKECFAFGSLISATDPVSVLAIFKEMDADENLYAIIFGESIFNDAIALVMYQTVMMMGKDGNSVGHDILASIGQFNLIFIGSLLIGAVSALLISFMLKR